MTQQNPQLQVTAVRNPSGKKFDHWEMSVDGSACKPADCTVTVAHGNNAVFKVSVSDPDGPPSGPQQIVFASNSLSVPPTPKVEITNISGQGTTSLSFKDHNLDQGTLKYTLNFNNAPSIDPIIQNGGGGPPGYTTKPGFLPTTTTAFAIDLLIAFVIGAIVALLVRRMTAARETG
jgi:hypothetical protein